jgi:hypothetical protein
VSLLAVQGGATGTGTVTLLAPVTNTNRTLTLPDETTTVVGTDATQTLTNKSIAVTQLTGTLPVANGGTGVTASTGSGNNVLSTSPTLTTPNINSAQFATVSGTAPLYAARAWVNFNGTGTVVINASGNVSSITDNGTGDYTVNFTTALPDINYALSGFATNGGAGMVVGLASSASTAAPTTKTTTAARLSARTTSGGLQDVYDCSVILLR